MKKLMLSFVTISLLAFVTSCTLSFSNADTHGTASDVIDSEPKADAQVSPTLSVPVKPL